MKCDVCKTVPCKKDDVVVGTFCTVCSTVVLNDDQDINDILPRPLTRSVEIVPYHNPDYMSKE